MEETTYYPFDIPVVVEEQENLSCIPFILPLKMHTAGFIDISQQPAASWYSSVSQGAWDEQRSRKMIIRLFLLTVLMENDPSTMTIIRA